MLEKTALPHGNLQTHRAMCVSDRKIGFGRSVAQEGGFNRAAKSSSSDRGTYMELITILRSLSRHRVLVILAGLLAIVTAVGVTYRAGASQHKVGRASATVLVDTPRSTVADLNPNGAGALLARTQLLANLMASGPLEVMIAQGARISPDQLVVVPPATAGTIVPTSIALGAAAASPSRGYLLNINTDPTLPLISISAQAPSATQASRLASSAVSSLQRYLGSVAGSQKIPAGNRPVITSLGPPKTSEVLQGSRRLYGLLAGVLVFILLCATIVIVSGIARLWRSSAADDQEPQGPWPRIDWTTATGVKAGSASSDTRTSTATIDSVSRAVSSVINGSSVSHGSNGGIAKTEGTDAPSRKDGPSGISG
jgi:hypothetical protein